MSREAFERQFPIPEGVYWRLDSERYNGTHRCFDSDADDYTRKLEIWQAALASREGEASPQAAVPDVNELSNFIRMIDGNHRMGAGILAEKICEWIVHKERTE